MAATNSAFIDVGRIRRAAIGLKSLEFSLRFVEKLERHRTMRGCPAGSQCCRYECCFDYFFTRRARSFGRL